MEVKIDGVETELFRHASPIKGMRNHFELAPKDKSCAYSFSILPIHADKIRTNGHVFEFANEKGEYR